jgi:hypothetical protein
MQLLVESLCLPPKFLLLFLKLPLLLLNSCSKGSDVISGRSSSDSCSSMPQQYKAGRHKQTYPPGSMPVSTRNLRACSHKLPLGIRFDSLSSKMVPDFCNAVERSRLCNCCANSARAAALLTSSGKTGSRSRVIHIISTRRECELSV